MSLGTTCEYESPDPAVVEKNIEETRRWCELAQDLGCVGVKVRPNGFPKDVPEDKTLDQIGHALARCGDIARDHGVEIWLEVHGTGHACFRPTLTTFSAWRIIPPWGRAGIPTTPTWWTAP